MICGFLVYYSEGWSILLIFYLIVIKIFRSSNLPLFLRFDESFLLCRSILSLILRYHYQACAFPFYEIGDILSVGSVIFLETLISCATKTCCDILLTIFTAWWRVIIVLYWRVANIRHLLKPYTIMPHFCIFRGETNSGWVAWADHLKFNKRFFLKVIVETRRWVCL